MAHAAAQLYNCEELTVYVRLSLPMTTYAAPQLGRWTAVARETRFVLP